MKEKNEKTNNKPVANDAGAETEAFGLTFPKGHIIADIGGLNCLIDTGCPKTISDKPAVTILGQKFMTMPNLAGVTTALLTKETGSRIDVLIGTDILGRFPWILDWNGAKITFFRKPQTFGGTILELTEFMGSPIVEFAVDGKKVNAILDTGAPLQFKPPDFEAGAPLREQADFMPTFGPFTTEVFRLPIEFGGIRIEDAEFGNLPSHLHAALELCGVGWILGRDVLNKQPLAFDLINGRLHILEV
jgi:hypothetical protein